MVKSVILFETCYPMVVDKDDTRWRQVMEIMPCSSSIPNPIHSQRIIHQSAPTISMYVESCLQRAPAQPKSEKPTFPILPLCTLKLRLMTGRIRLTTGSRLTQSIPHRGLRSASKPLFLGNIKARCDSATKLTTIARTTGIFPPMGFAFMDAPTVNSQGRALLFFPQQLRCSSICLKYWMKSTGRRTSRGSHVRFTWESCKTALLWTLCAGRPAS